MEFDGMRVVSIDTGEHDLFIVRRYCMELRLNVSNFNDSIQAMTFVIEQDVDLVIINYDMPDLDGLDFTTDFKKRHKDIPLVLTLNFQKEDEKKKKEEKRRHKKFVAPKKQLEQDLLYKKAMEAGVDAILTKPLDEVLFKLTIKNLLQLRKSTLLLKDRSKLLQEEIEKVTKELKKREFETLDILSKTSEYKDHAANLHISRLSHYSKILAEGYGLSEKVQDILFHAAALHDIGKVGMPDKLLLTPRDLKDDEIELLKKHTLIGYDILKNAKDPYLTTGRNIALTHHERYDGSGYPHGLKGHKIPIEGRIVALADVFDALTSERAYKKSWDFDEAVEYIKKQSAKQFDPDIVKIFVKNIKKIKKVYDEYK